jgi:hypothetical protein
VLVTSDYWLIKLLEKQLNEFFFQFSRANYVVVSVMRSTVGPFNTLF